MKKIKKIVIFLLLPIYLIGILASCGDDYFPKEDPYKRAKEKHKFFRCKINGKEWHEEYSSGWFGWGGSGMEFYEAPDSVEKSGKFNIRMDYEPNKDILEGIVIEIKRGLKEGENSIKYWEGDSKFRVYWLIEPIDNIFFFYTTYNNELFITDIDTANHIITGTFEFKAVRWDKIDTVLVTDGEFDWKPNWYRWR